MHNPLTSVFISILVANACCAQQPSTTSSPKLPPSYLIKLATVEETRQSIAIINTRAFLTTDSLKRYLATLPPDSIVSVRLWQQHDNAFVKAIPDLKKLCEEKKIKFSVAPDPFF